MPALGYTGQRRSTITDHYPLGNGYRSFNPIIKRFIAWDNLSPFNIGKGNGYLYCSNDPINQSDPSGQGPVFDLIFAAVELAARNLQRSLTLEETAASEEAKGIPPEIFTKIMHYTRIGGPDLEFENTAQNIPGVTLKGKQMLLDSTEHNIEEVANFAFKIIMRMDTRIKPSDIKHLEIYAGRRIHMTTKLGDQLVLINEKQQGLIRLIKNANEELKRSYLDIEEEYLNSIRINSEERALAPAPLLELSRRVMDKNLLPLNERNKKVHLFINEIRSGGYFSVK